MKKKIPSDFEKLADAMAKLADAVNDLSAKMPYPIYGGGSYHLPMYWTRPPHYVVTIGAGGGGAGGCYSGGGGGANV